MLAKQNTAIKAKRTIQGFEPAMLNRRVINIRSMFDLLSAAEIVKPPTRSMIVGEYMTKNVSGKHPSMICSEIDSMAYLVALGVGSGKGFSPSEWTTLKMTKRNRARVEVIEEWDHLRSVSSEVAQ
jgi:hypothetical protein